MYSTTTRTKAPKGTVQIRNSNDRLQLVFSWGGKRHYLSLGLPDTLANRRLAQAKAQLIESDIALDRFDPTLGKYKAQSAMSIGVNATPMYQYDLRDLWGRYTKEKSRSLSQTTIAKDFTRWSAHIEQFPSQNPADAVQIRNWLVSNCSSNTAKRCLTQLSAACEWAQKQGLIPTNPFKGMAADLKLPKAERSDTGDIDPFTHEERDRILEAFQTNRYYHHYYPLVRFLFSTGCRPSEAVALQWQHVTPDFRQISFESAITPGKKGLARKAGLKTQERRRFPANEPLRAFLASIKPEGAADEDLVFTAPGGGWIDPHNLSNRGWKAVLQSLPDIRYRKMYQTRHSFITLALDNGLVVQDVARLVGNSPECIYRFYAGNRRHLQVPEF